MRAVYRHCLADFSEQVFIANATKREAIFVQFLAGGALECLFSFSLVIGSTISLLACWWTVLLGRLFRNCRPRTIRSGSRPPSPQGCRGQKRTVSVLVVPAGSKHLYPENAHFTVSHTHAGEPSPLMKDLISLRSAISKKFGFEQTAVEHSNKSSRSDLCFTKMLMPMNRSCNE
jgi:hypothetical protein